MMYDDDLANMEEWLRRLKIEYHIFFNGNRKQPPEDLKIRVERLVKKLSECSELSFSQRFRLNTLIARFYIYRDLWRRTLLEKEMGAEPKEGTAFKEKGIPEFGKTAPEAVRISIADPNAEEDKIRLLYDSLVRIKKTGTGETPIPYAQFAKYIATQTRSIREKYGCSAVAFTIALDEHAIRFTAAADSR
jgi:hypothetical protein